MRHAPPTSLLLIVLGACGSPEGVTPRADVVLVLVDTLRADALSCYGQERETTPHLDELARTGARFEECLAQAPNTATSHATLFTGLHPWAHRVANLTSLEHGTAGLPPVFETLAERFAEAGYRTGAFTDGGPLGTAWNLHQGFEVHESRYEGVEAKVDRALEFLDEGDDRPVFLFLHTYQVHLPYLAPLEWADRFDPEYDGPLRAAEAEVRAQREAGGEVQPDGKLLLANKDEFTERDVEHLVALYHGEVAYTDHHLARLWDRLRERGRLDDTVIAVTSDHGEEFGEHGRFGHVQLHRETLRVPLILRLPGGEGALGRGAVVETPVELIDLHATLLEAAGLELVAGIGGRSLLSALRGEPFPELPAFAVTTEHLYGFGRELPARRSVRRDGRAYLRTELGGEAEHLVYELSDDPDEQRPVYRATAPAGVFEGEGRGLLFARSDARAVDEHLDDQERLRVVVVDGGSTVFHHRPDQKLIDEMQALGYMGH